LQTRAQVLYSYVTFNATYLCDERHSVTWGGFQ